MMLWNCLVPAAISDNKTSASCLRCLTRPSHLLSGLHQVRWEEDGPRSCFVAEQLLSLFPLTQEVQRPIKSSGLVFLLHLLSVVHSQVEFQTVIKPVKMFSWFVHICWVITLVWCNYQDDVIDVELFGKTEDTGWLITPPYYLRSFFLHLLFQHHWSDCLKQQPEMMIKQQVIIGQNHNTCVQHKHWDVS